MKHFIMLCLVALSLSGYSQTFTLECLKNEMVDKRGNCSSCPNTDELFTGIRITRPTGVKQKLYSPIKAKLYSDSTFIGLIDCYGNSASIRISQIATYDTFTTLLDFLIDCSLVDIGGGGGGVDSSDVAAQIEAFRTASVSLTNKTINGSLNSLSNIPQSSVTGLTAALTGKASVDSLGNYLKRSASDTIFGVLYMSDKPGFPSPTYPYLKLESAAAPYVIELAANSGLYMSRLGEAATMSLQNSNMQINREGEYTPTADNEVLVQGEIKSLISDSLATVSGGGGGISKTANDTVFTYQTVWKDGSYEARINNNTFLLTDGTSSIGLNSGYMGINDGGNRSAYFDYTNLYLYDDSDASKIDLYSNHMTIDRQGYSATGPTEVPILSEVKQLISDSIATRPTTAQVGAMIADSIAGISGGGTDTSYNWRHRSDMMGGAASISGDGVAFTVTTSAGAAQGTVSISSINKALAYPHTKLYANSASNAVAGCRHSVNTIHRGQYGGGGFEIIARVSLKDATNYYINPRFFMGLNGNSNAAPTDVNPSSKTNILGIGWDSGDANIQIFHNDGSGTATKINTGIDIPDNGVDDVFYVRLFATPGSSSVKITAGRVELNSYYTSTVSSDIPAISQLMYFDTYASAGGVADDAGINFIDMICYTK